MGAVYADLDLLIAPSRWEGFGLMLVEAMASGVPIVGTQLEVIEETVGTSGPAMLVPPESPCVLAEAMMAILRDAGARAGMSSAGIKRAEAYSWEATANKLAGIYDEVLTSAPPATL